ncbi:hypothetical protein DNTS_000605 [Danionella cerebrum]|uniref:Uncharacterized protein n=1 Tax=Danionella cerebrum TaxID=2873325 RepID=A0A553REW6_9TELE|nr:hypothetical protein DNTS_000605 [Danionella translucida]
MSVSKSVLVMVNINGSQEFLTGLLVVNELSLWDNTGIQHLVSVGIDNENDNGWRLQIQITVEDSAGEALPADSDTLQYTVTPELVDNQEVLHETYKIKWVESSQQFDRRLLVKLTNRLIQWILVLVQPASNVVVHSSSIMDQGEVGLSLALGRLWFLEGIALAKMLVVQLVLEGCICCLGEHALLFKDGEDTHGLFKKELSLLSLLLTLLLLELHVTVMEHSSSELVDAHLLFIAKAQNLILAQMTPKQKYIQLVDLGLSNVSTLLSLLQLMLHLPQLGQVGVGLFLLQNTYSFFRLPLVSLDLQLKFVNKILQSALYHQTNAYPGLEFLELFLSTLHGQILSLIQTMLQVLHIIKLLAQYLRVQQTDTLTGIHQLLLSHFTAALSSSISDSIRVFLRSTMATCSFMSSWPLTASSSSLAIGMAQLNLHLIKISLHLLLDSQGIISAPDLRVQSALHGFNDSLAVPLDLLHLLILLCKLPVDLTLNLVELKLDSKNLGLLMLQVPLCAGWHQFHIWSSTEQLHCWPLTFLSGAQPLPPALPQTAPGAGRSRDGLTAQRGPSCSLSTEIVYLAQVLIILGLKFTKLVLKERITRRKADLCFGYSLHVAGEIIDLHLVFTLLFLKLLLDTLQVIDLLSQLSHTVGLLLAQSCSGSFMLESGLFKITAQLLEFSFTLLVHLNLSCSGSTGLLKPLTDLLKFPGEISSLLLNLSTSCTLSLNLFLQFLNASLELGIHSFLLSSTSIQECLMNQNGKYLKLLDLLLELSTQRLFIFNLAEQLACFKVFPLSPDPCAASSLVQGSPQAMRKKCLEMKTNVTVEDSAGEALPADSDTLQYTVTPELVDNQEVLHETYKIKFTS